jgi:D-serine deaminase-like pyridoxal phosphate-dependent protein
MTSNMGMAQKSAAASYWDAKTTEIFIPEMGEEGA